ncbi:NFX1-type zinc finger-containing protein 1-like [Branchiostoma floridae]|uniref:NFX1-type zinc finger-containing protein 1-like n=2 Tax=Branchiostoma floridae TaxID=7739 RepID=A0A9J7LC56_BRAFL|nr:NFX1-type zinc finger-containing protein 1-like [Branchiostoma floridae]
MDEATLAGGVGSLMEGGTGEAAISRRVELSHRHTTHYGLRDDYGTLATRLHRQLRLETPPDDFRELTIIPTFEDIHSDKEPFLRTNIDRGRYRDVDTYLDTQFRLLREDFVRPLREGIEDFLYMRRRGLDQERKLQDIRVYHDVHVVYPTYSNQGMVHRIQFDSSRLKGVRWQSSKRLIYGSLVCLTKDEFNTMYFATVVNSNPKELEQGWVDVRFENDTSAVIGISSMDTFIMVETTAFFEAYRHVLKGLQEVEDDKMPFTKYIVDCDCADGVDPPAYLRRSFGAENVKYDLSVVKNVYSRPNLQPMQVPVLRGALWPSAEDLGFDESQYRAFRLGLTREFAVIQGPPGTGKTYIGLKIIEVLLRNSFAWQGHNGGLGMTGNANSPILVVCYTNHALDQFLEGIEESYPEGIVRVGGQSKSKKLERFKLKNIRHKVRQSKLVPQDIKKRAANATREKKRLEKEMDMHLDKLTATQSVLLHENTLMDVMDRRHRTSLMEGWQEADEYEWRTGGKKRGSAIEDWLGLGGQVLPEVDKQDHGTQEEDQEEETIDMEDPEEMRRLLDDDEVLYGPVDRRQHTRNAVSVDRALDLNSMHIKEHRAEDSGGWQVQVNKKKRRNMLKHELSKTEMMTHEEARQVRDVWTLQPRDRWRLYRYWVARYCDLFKRPISACAKRYEDVARRLDKIRNEEDRRIMEEACVIGMTTTGAAKNRSILQAIQPAIIIVEEAAEVLEAHIVTTLSQQCQHLILIGDHQQLRPNPTVYELAKKYKMDISLFERMVNNDMQCVRLQSQHRMRPEFARLLTPHIYDSLDNHESVLNYENIKGVSSNLFFLDHSYKEAHAKDTKSRSNMHEAQFLASFCRYLLQQGYSPSQITILTTYTGQLFNFKDVMPRQVFQGVRVCTVDNFQGEENDIILLSLVRSNDENIAGFLKVENRVCVALSRAKKGFYAIGNLTMLAEASTLWKEIIQELRRQGSIGTSLTLSCQNHPDSKILVSTADDFKETPNGGCMRPCGFRLQCGHLCGMRCHLTDPEHEEYECPKPCAKVLCDLGHRCPDLCYQDCGKCEVLVEKTIPICQHKQKVRCHEKARPFQCQMPCEKVLPCRHRCKNKCNQECSVPCMEMVQHQFPCGHTIQAACSVQKDDMLCNIPCRNLLKCGHQCAGTCDRCKQGRLHQQCRQPYNRVLVCSHQCRANCTHNCPPCAEPCENHCIHGLCRHKCGEPCVPCQEPCEWTCRHHKCDKPCGEPCDRPRCHFACQKLRRCDRCKKVQSCIGMCGEPCPNRCRVCDHQELTKDVFGTEDEPDARFVLLEDCGHVLEVGGMDYWMDETSKTIQLKTCPKCRTPIRYNLRYGNTIKRTLAKIEIVKNKQCVPKAERRTTAKRFKNDLLSDVDLQWYCAGSSSDLLVQVERFSLSSPDQVAMFEKKIFFLKKIARRKDEMERLRVLGDKPHIMELDREIAEMENWLLRPTAHVNEQEWDEFGTEMSRMNFLLKLRVLQGQIRKKGISLDDQDKVLLDYAEGVLTELKPFTEKREELVKQALRTVKDLTRQYPAPRAAIARSAGVTSRLGPPQVSVRQPPSTENGRAYESSYSTLFDRCTGARRRGQPLVSTRQPPSTEYGLASESSHSTVLERSAGTSRRGPPQASSRQPTSSGDGRTYESSRSTVPERSAGTSRRGPPQALTRQPTSSGDGRTYDSSRSTVPERSAGTSRSREPPSTGDGRAYESSYSTVFDRSAGATRRGQSYVSSRQTPSTEEGRAYDSSRSTVPERSVGTSIRGPPKASARQPPSTGDGRTYESSRSTVPERSAGTSIRGPPKASARQPPSTGDGRTYESSRSTVPERSAGTSIRGPPKASARQPPSTGDGRTYDSSRSTVPERSAGTSIRGPPKASARQPPSTGDGRTYDSSRSTVPERSAGTSIRGPPKASARQPPSTGDGRTYDSSRSTVPERSAGTSIRGPPKASARQPPSTGDGRTYDSSRSTVPERSAGTSIRGPPKASARQPPSTGDGRTYDSSRSTVPERSAGTSRSREPPSTGDGRAYESSYSTVFDRSAGATRRGQSYVSARQTPSTEEGRSYDSSRSTVSERSAGTGRRGQTQSSARQPPGTEEGRSETHSLIRSRLDFFESL